MTNDIRVINEWLINLLDIENVNYLEKLSKITRYCFVMIVEQISNFELLKIRADRWNNVAIYERITLH